MRAHRRPRSAGTALLLGTAGALILVAGVHLLREATMSRHYPNGPDTRLEVVVTARSDRPRSATALARAVTAKVDRCTLEVAAQREGDVRPLAGTDGRYSFTLAPSLDSSDRKQYRGCLEDWNVDHLLVGVSSMTDGRAS